MPGNDVTALRDWTEIDTSTDGQITSQECEAQRARVTRMVVRAGASRQFALATSLEAIETRWKKLAEALKEAENT